MDQNGKLREKLDELCRPYCTSHWCIYKEMLLHSHNNLRTAVQLKLIEIFQWNWSQREGREIGWDESCMRWAENGMAKRFADLYNEDISVNNLYSQIETDCHPF